MANKFHKDLFGNDLHIARAEDGIVSPVGIITPGIVGQLFVDTVAKKLYLADGLTNTDWFNESAAFDTFLELTDVFETTYVGQASKIPQVNSLETGLEFTDSLILKGQTSGVSLDLTSTLGAFRPNRLTTTQRDALTALAGMTIFNTTTSQLETFNGTAWIGDTANDSFLELIDVDPTTYVGQTGKVVQVNNTPDGLEFGQDLRTTASPTFKALSLEGGPENNQLKILSANLNDSAAIILGNSTEAWAIKIRTDPFVGWFEITNDGDAVAHRWFAADYMLAASGILYWSKDDTFSSAGVIDADVNLFRNSANVLRTNDSFIVDIDLTVKGKALFQNGTDSLTAFQILDTDGGVPIFNVDSINERIGIKTAAPTATLDLAGNVLITNDVAANIPFLIKGASGQTADLIEIVNSALTVIFSIGAQGNVFYQNTTDSLSAFQVSDVSGNPPIFKIDTLNGRGSINKTTPTVAWDVVGDGAFSGDLEVIGAFKDSSGDVGTLGQLLSSTVTGTNWIDQTGVDTFLELTDTPAAYAAQGSVVQVNVTADALEFGQKLRTGDDPQFLTLGLGTIAGAFPLTIKSGSSGEGIELLGTSGVFTPAGIRFPEILSLGTDHITVRGPVELSASYIIEMAPTPSDGIGQLQTYSISGNTVFGTFTQNPVIGGDLTVLGDVFSKGTSWTSRTSAADNGWLGVTYGNGLFVAVSDTGTGNRIMTSPDGVNWTLRTSPADNDWFCPIYGNGLFVVVANTGTGDRVMTSPDGINWTLRTSAADNQWRALTYGNNLFVAVADSGTGDRVMTSPDGITWTLRTSAADNRWLAVTFGNGLFVAVAATGTNNRVMTSPDGITWTLRTSAADNGWLGVTYGNGLFVAVSFDGLGNRVMTSPDGITWTIRTSAANNSWISVTYGNGLFVAVASTGTGDRIMTSSNGIDWVVRTNPVDNQWVFVTYGNGIFVSVANTGTGDRVMTSGKIEINEVPNNNIFQGGLEVRGDFNSLSLGRLPTVVSINSGKQVIIGVTDTTVGRTVTIRTVDINADRVFIIKDESGAASNPSPITIVTEGSETIDGLTSVQIKIPFGVVRLYAAGGNLFSW